MDFNTIGTYAGSISFLIHIGQAIFSLINHKIIRSSCCGRQGHISIDVDDTTPKTKQLKQVLIEPNPMNKPQATFDKPQATFDKPNLNLHT